MSRNLVEVNTVPVIPIGNCPNEGDLIAFSAGKLPDRDLERLAKHVGKYVDPKLPPFPYFGENLEKHFNAGR